MNAQDRFAGRVQKTETCWLWLGPRRFGYGRFWLNGKTVQAHRAAWMLHRGPIPDGLCVLHTCDTRNCVNPDHLWLGTKGDNNTDRARKGRNGASGFRYEQPDLPTVYVEQPDLEERFMSKVRCGDDCWEWDAARDRVGFGYFQLGGKAQKAHRVAYELLVGPIPDGLHIRQRCGNRSCVNPDHMQLATPNWHKRKAGDHVESLNATDVLATFDTLQSCDQIDVGVSS